MLTATTRLVEQMDHGPSTVEEASTSISLVVQTQVVCPVVLEAASYLSLDICPSRSSTRRTVHYQRKLPMQSRNLGLAGMDT